MQQIKQPKCTCADPIPTTPHPPLILCLKCGGTLAIDHETALCMAIASVEKSQSKSLRAAGIAFFLEDQGFDFDEIYESLEKQAKAAEAAKGVRNA